MQYSYAIVETGGAFDCSFGVGIQKALHERLTKHHPFIRIGSSGSTMSTSFFTANQIDEGYHVLTEYLSNQNLVSKGRFIHEVDVEGIMYHVEKSLDIDGLINSPQKAFLALTEYETGKNIYLSNHDPNSKEMWIQFMKGSMAIPLCFKKKIIINGKRYTDGDIASPLVSHIHKALSHGATKVIAINNHSPQTIFQKDSLIILAYMLVEKYHRKGLYKRIKNHVELKKEIENLKHRIIFLSPPHPLPTRNFHNSKEAIKSSINIGFEYALQNEKLKNFLEEF